MSRSSWSGALACKVCGNASRNGIVSAREMMFGTREIFDYLDCSACGCMQLIDVPVDLSPFYPDGYYSLGYGPPAQDRQFVTFIKRARTHLLVRAPVRIVETLVRAECAPDLFMWLAGLGLGPQSAICDIGSGDGQSLVAMLRQGFSNLSGFDPYIDGDRSIRSEISIRKGSVDQLHGRWDLIMLNHSFEHMANPAWVLRRLRECLNHGGHIIIRVPVADSYARRTYGKDWVQLDAPRHLFIHTRRSMEILAEMAGLATSRVFFDSHAFQFWGSEQYRRDIPLRDPRSYAENPETDLFSRSEIEQFEHRANDLNKRGDGDSAGFVLSAVQQLRRQAI
jgi:hypothetical protein